MNQMTNASYKRKDFLSDQEPRWCSGCGDYFILQALTGVWAELGIPKENFLVVSGIGCSSRFPYYADTYGFHTIHGRAPTVAIGAALTNPDLSIWVITGDGDGMSIGGNHLIHLLRRNANINVILFNNEIYGLTKGQASPTSTQELKTKSTPFGVTDRAINPLKLALAAGASFVARAVDTNLAMMKEVFHAAAEHRGTSFIEIYTNCVVFNDGAFDEVEKRKNWKENTIHLQHDQPLLFGTNHDKKIVLNGLTPRVLTREDADYDQTEALIHDVGLGSTVYHNLLAEMSYPSFPLPMGVLRRVDEVEFVSSRLRTAQSAEKSGLADLDALFRRGETWGASSGKQ